MTINPAKELLEIFEEWTSEGGSLRSSRRLDTPEGISRTRTALHCLDAIVEQLAILEAKQLDVADLRAAADDWFREIVAYNAQWDFSQTAIGHLDLLRTLRTLIDMGGPAIVAPSPSRAANLRENLSVLLHDVLEAIKRDETLDRHLREHLFAAVVHVRACLDRFEVTGVFDLARAIKDLEIFLASAQAMTRADSGVWDRLRRAVRDFTTNPTTAGVAGAIAGSGVSALVTGS